MTIRLWQNDVEYQRHLDELANQFSLTKQPQIKLSALKILDNYCLA